MYLKSFSDLLIEMARILSIDFSRKLLNKLGRSCLATSKSKRSHKKFLELSR